MRKTDFNSRLNAYFATLRRFSPRDGLRRSAENWHIYAAVTGSTLAMASSASAGLIYSGPIDVTATAASVALGNTSHHSSSQKIRLKNASGKSLSVGFAVSALQYVDKKLINGLVGLEATGIGFLMQNRFVRRLSAGARISPGQYPSSRTNGFLFGKTPRTLAFHLTYATGKHSTLEWKNHEGYAAFEFSNAGKMDLGWIKLEYTIGPDGLENSISALGWAYDDTGAPIVVGETPEPSTFGLTLLAAGAAGVAALRRRRKSAA